MAENVEFVNSYIEKLNKAVHDLTGRNVVLETRLEMAEKALGQLNVELEQARQDALARSKQIDQMRNENRQLGGEVSNLREQLVAAQTKPADIDIADSEVIEISPTDVDVEPQEEKSEPDDF